MHEGPYLSIVVPAYNEETRISHNLKKILFYLGRKGYAVKRGMLNAKGSYILFTDADLSTPIAELDKFLQVIQSGYDIAIGSRKISGAQIEVHQSWLREFIGKGFHYPTKNFGDFPGIQ